MKADLTLAFTTGLFGGFGHCIGMCGPVVAAFSLRRREGRRITSHLLYNAGRVITYTFIGAVMGLGGSFVNTAGRITGLQNTVAIIAGTLMVFMGLGIAGLLPGAGRLEGGAGFFLKAAGPLLESGSSLQFFPLGLLFGFLPCGLSYTIFIGAAATGDMLSGFLLALSFGLATIPSLLFFGVVVGSLGARTRGLLYRAGGAVVVVMGIVFIVRGVTSLAAL